MLPVDPRSGESPLLLDAKLHVINLRRLICETYPTMPPVRYFPYQRILYQYHVGVNLKNTGKFAWQESVYLECGYKDASQVTST